MACASPRSEDDDEVCRRGVASICGREGSSYLTPEADVRSPEKAGGCVVSELTADGQVRSACSFRASFACVPTGDSDLRLGLYGVVTRLRKSSSSRYGCECLDPKNTGFPLDASKIVSRANRNKSRGGKVLLKHMYVASVCRFGKINTRISHADQEYTYIDRPSNVFLHATLCALLAPRYMLSYNL